MYTDNSPQRKTRTIPPSVDLLFPHYFTPYIDNASSRFFQNRGQYLKIDDTLFYEEMFAGSSGQVYLNAENYNTNSNELQALI